MSRKKSHLRKDKNRGTPANRKKAADRSVTRRLHNAALKYSCCKTDFESCRLVLPLLPFEEDRLYQQILIDSRHFVLKRPRCLSLFDGISSGLVALQQMGINPHVYFSSEIDIDCKKLQRFNFADKVCQLGDICHLTFEKLKELGQIDILFGGSPCNDISRVNHKRRGLYGSEGTGPLFFQFVRVMLFFKFKAQLEKRDFFWFYENTSCMDAETKEIITEYLGCEPISICSSYFVPMKRTRYFWTNIPIPEDRLSSLIQAAFNKESHGELQKYLCGSGRTATANFVPTVTSNMSNQSKGGCLPVLDEEDGPSHLYFSEMEKLFGFPVNYTAGPNATLSTRKKLISKTWDTHTISFILSFVLEYLVVVPI